MGPSSRCHLRTSSTCGPSTGRRAHGGRGYRAPSAKELGFPLVEGYFLGPDGSGSGTGMRGAPRRGFSQWLAEIVQHEVARQATAEQVSHFRDDLAVWQVDVVVLPPRDDRAILQRSVASVLGEPTAVDDVLLWDVRGLR